MAKRLSKELQAVMALAEELGFEWDGKMSGGGHIKMKHKSNGTMVVLPSTPSRPSWQKNIISEIKRRAKEDPK